MTVIRSYQTDLLGILNARFVSLLASPPSHVLVPGTGNSPRMVNAAELRAVPYPPLVARGRPRFTDRISFFGLSLSDYSIWSEIDSNDRVPHIFINDHDAYSFEHFGFAVYHGLNGIANGGGFSYCSRVFLHDTTSRISVDSHLPVDYEDLDVFQGDFQLLMTHLMDIGLDPGTTSAIILYGSEPDPSNYANEVGAHVADIVVNHGLASCLSYPIFEGGCDQYILLDGSQVWIDYTDSYLHALLERRQKLHEHLRSLSVLCNRILDMGVDRTHHEMPGSILTMIEILESQNDLLEADKKLNIDFFTLDPDSEETIASLRDIIKHMMKSDLLVHAADSNIIDGWIDLMKEDVATTRHSGTRIH